MAHQSLYRKYRPMTFDDIVGQQHIERTLRNAVANDTVAHAYLFAGPRGTGKTTSARLLAKALLCQDGGPTPNPDGTCEDCKAVALGDHPDVIELDAASRTGVDNVREEIINRVQYAPQRGKYKVYIIDEVHMLSTGAFNAMLKTLEEPPPHVVFILCTTHPQKVPETVRSRCQQFDFHPISTDDMVDRLRFIAQSENIEIDTTALSLIAKHAEGGMRDAITTLEQLAALTGSDISVDDVEGVLGEVDSEALAELLDSVARCDTGACFRWIQTQVEMGSDLVEVNKSLIGFVRDLYVLAVLANSEGVVDRTDEDIVALRSLVSAFDDDKRIVHLLAALTDVAASMRWSTEPRIVLELALVRATHPENELTLEALTQRIEALEQGEGAVATRPAVKTQPKVAPVAKPSEEDEVTVAGSFVPSIEPEVPVQTVPAGGTGHWHRVLADIQKMAKSRYALFADTQATLSADGGTVVVHFPAHAASRVTAAMNPASVTVVEDAIERVYGRRLAFTAKVAEKPVPAATTVPVAAPTPEMSVTSVPDISMPENPVANIPTTTPTTPPEALIDNPIASMLAGLGAQVLEHGAIDGEADETLGEDQPASFAGDYGNDTLSMSFGLDEIDD